MWFSLNPENPVISSHLSEGGRAAILKNGNLVLAKGTKTRDMVNAANIPATMGGVARHNVQNALGAMALCSVLGADDQSIRIGLEGFNGDEEDNPGRGNWFENRGVKILVDFAHNEHGMHALADMVSAVESNRRILLTGQAGDRLDKDISDMVKAACGMQPDIILACALPGYERGRPQSEVQDIIRASSVASGVADENIHNFDSPVAASRYALENARSGDLLVFLALTQREAVLELVHEFIGK
jgi:UDP-N-acetylmuramyl tripeptide synthase